MKKFDELMNVSNEITNISIDEAKKKLNDPNVQFIDVRDKNSFESETIGNAINLERGLLEFYLASSIEIFVISLETFINSSNFFIFKSFLFISMNKQN